MDTVEWVSKCNPIVFSKEPTCYRKGNAASWVGWLACRCIVRIYEKLVWITCVSYIALGLLVITTHCVLIALLTLGLTLFPHEVDFKCLACALCELLVWATLPSGCL